MTKQFEPTSRSIIIEGAAAAPSIIILQVQQQHDEVKSLVVVISLFHLFSQVRNAHKFYVTKEASPKVTHFIFQIEWIMNHTKDIYQSSSFLFYR